MGDAQGVSAEGGRGGEREGGKERGVNMLTSGLGENREIGSCQGAPGVGWVHPPLCEPPDQR